MDSELCNRFTENSKKVLTSRDYYKMVFTDENNKDIEYEIVATFRNKVNKKIYYIMTDNTRDKDNKLNITAYYINYNEESKENTKFYPVIDDDELKMVLDVFLKIQNNV